MKPLLTLYNWPRRYQKSSSDNAGHHFQLPKTCARSSVRALNGDRHFHGHIMHDSQQRVRSYE